MNPDIEAVLRGERQWAVICADNREVLPTLPDKSVAHVITDPPYEAEAHTLQRRVMLGSHPGRATGRRPGDLVGEAPLDFPAITPKERDEASHALVRVSAGWVLAFCQAEGIDRWRASLEAAGARWRRAGIWVKPDCMPQLTGDRWAQGYEAIASAWAGQGKSRWRGGGRSGVFTHIKNVTGSREAAPHPTTKPIPLMLELVSLFTDPEELVLDPFAGSGTTGVACLRLGRRFIGIEKDEKYAAIARERLEAESRGLSLRDARAGQSSIFDVLGVG